MFNIYFNQVPALFVSSSECKRQESNIHFYKLASLSSTLCYDMTQAKCSQKQKNEKAKAMISTHERTSGHKQYNFLFYVSSHDMCKTFVLSLLTAINFILPLLKLGRKYFTRHCIRSSVAEGLLRLPTCCRDYNYIMSEKQFETINVKRAS